MFLLALIIVLALRSVVPASLASDGSSDSKRRSLAPPVGNVLATNVYGPDGLIARKVGSTSTYYTFDQQGNVSQRLSSSESVLSSSIYDAYGVESSSGSPSDPFAYNAQWGYYLDRETGLYSCMFRYYDPAQGRWLNRDPISYSGGVNLYGYCGANPVFWFDRTGAMPQRAAEAAVLVEMEAEAAGNIAAAARAAAAFDRIMSGARTATTLAGTGLATQLGKLPPGAREAWDECLSFLGNAMRIAERAIPGNGPVAGTAKHMFLRRASEAAQQTAEYSHIGGKWVPYGTPGSVRIDLLLGRYPFDWKFGNSALSGARAEALGKGLGGPAVPIRYHRP